MVTEDDVRRIALSLPSTTEKSSYGTPGFRVKDRLFARIHEEGDVLILWVESEEEKLAMIATDPALERAEHAAYRERLVTRYERGFELFRVG